MAINHKLRSSDALSDHKRHRLHRGGNRRLNSVLYTAAIVQKRFHPAAQELLARLEPAKGKGCGSPSVSV
ncbi:transposase [Nonomuraea sp. NPDC003707]